MTCIPGACVLPPAWEGSWFEAGSGPQGVTIGNNTISHKVGGSGGGLEVYCGSNQLNGSSADLYRICHLFLS